MMKLWVGAFAVVLASCASSGAASRDGSASAARSAPPSTSGATSTGSAPRSSSEATPTGPGAAGATDGRQQASSAELANARGRLQEAQREMELAQSESAGADAQVRAARAQMESANKSVDSIAQARAAEVVRAAEIRAQTAAAHLDYATKLLAARQADVDAAQVALQSSGAVPVGGGTSGADQSSAAQAVATSRAHAVELGQVALEAQRRWEEATQRDRAARPGDPTDTVGSTTSAPDASTTGTGTSAQPVPSGAPGGR